MNSFNYENTEIAKSGGKKIVRKVSIKKGRGFKSITKYQKGRKLHTVKKCIHADHVHLIKRGKFIPGLFSDCGKCKNKKCKHCKTKKLRGGVNDLEMGPTEIKQEYMKSVPPDPERFKKYEETGRLRSMFHVSPKETEKTFSGPNPEEKEVKEQQTMGDEDPLNKDPFERERLAIFKEE